MRVIARLFSRSFSHVYSGFISYCTVIANNNANIQSNSDNYLIDLTVHVKSIAKFVKPVKKIRLSRSQACSGFIS